MAVLHCNGSVADSQYHLSVDATRTPDLDALNDAFELSRFESEVERSDHSIEIGTEDIASASTREQKIKLRVLHSILQPKTPVNLTKTDQRSVALSDARWKSATVGWGTVARNHYSAKKENRNSIYLELQGEVFEKGLYAHSKSEFVFEPVERLPASAGAFHPIVRADDRQQHEWQ